MSASWIVIGLALVLASGIWNVLYRPWRIRPLHRFLYRQSRLYRRWCWHRMIVGTRRSAQALREMGRAAERATLATPKQRARKVPKPMERSYIVRKEFGTRLHYVGQADRR